MQAPAASSLAYITAAAENSLFSSVAKKMKKKAQLVLQNQFCIFRKQPKHQPTM